MKVATTRPALPMTYDEYALLPQGGNRYEVIEGELLMTPSPSLAHQYVVIGPASLFRQHVSASGLERVYVAPLHVVLTETNNVPVAADLVVEVTSPSSVEEDRGVKMRVYGRHVVSHCWLVQPEARTLEMYALAIDAHAVARAFSGGTTATTPLFPGLNVPPAHLWA